MMGRVYSSFRWVYLTPIQPQGSGGPIGLKLTTAASFLQIICLTSMLAAIVTPANVRALRSERALRRAEKALSRYGDGREASPCEKVRERTIGAKCAQLNLRERGQIQDCLSGGDPCRAIGNYIGKSISTVSCKVRSRRHIRPFVPKKAAC